MNRSFLNVIIGAVLIAFAASCGDDEPSTYERLQKELKTIDDYLAANNIDAIKEPNGVRMHITTMGTGLPAQFTSNINVDYRGTYFTTGNEFAPQANYNGSLENTIDGWKDALTSMPAGSHATLYIPSALGYGPEGNGSIPKNAILVFDVKFNSVVMTSTEKSRFTTDTTALNSYLANENITALKDNASGVRYVITNPGAGANATLYDQVHVKYSFKKMDDAETLIKELTGEPSADFPSRVVDYNYVQALVFGFQKLAPGGKIKMYVPSYSAFGAYGAYDNSVQVIAPNTNIIVEAELVSVE